jgi:hypothetical protein
VPGLMDNHLKPVQEILECRMTMRHDAILHNESGRRQTSSSDNQYDSMATAGSDANAAVSRLSAGTPAWGSTSGWARGGILSSAGTLQSAIKFFQQSLRM